MYLRQNSSPSSKWVSRSDRYPFEGDERHAEAAGAARKGYSSPQQVTAVAVAVVVGNPWDSGVKLETWDVRMEESNDGAKQDEEQRCKSCWYDKSRWYVA